MSTETIKALARRWFDSTSYHSGLLAAEASGNPKTAREQFFRSLIADVFSPGCVMHYPDGDGDYNRILQYHLVMLEAFPDLSFVIEDLIGEGDKVVIRGMMSGTNKGSFRGMPPTGNHVAMGFITICRTRAGKIVETWGYNDMAGFMRQLGTLPLSSMKK